MGRPRGGRCGCRLAVGSTVEEGPSLASEGAVGLRCAPRDMDLVPKAQYRHHRHPHLTLPIFDSYPALRAIGRKTGKTDDRDAFVTYVLEAVKTMGFDRVRFWEVTHDIACEEDVVVLTDQHPAGSSGCELGYLRALVESAVSVRPSSLEPVVEDRPANGKLDPFDELVGMEGRARVAVPVTAGRKVNSILACDWRGRAADLDDETLDALRLIGAQVGSFLALDRTRALATPNAPSLRREPEQATELVIDAARLVAQQIDAAATAVFEFTWPRQRLTKVRTLVAESLQDRFEQLGDFDEFYDVGGPQLTGAAWNDGTLRHIVSVDRVRVARNFWLADESVNWHSQLLGTTRSVLYVVVGALEERYLIRFINRASRPELPFVREEALVDELVSDLRAEVDAAVALQRLSNLQQVSALAAENAGPETVLETVGASLAQESVTDFVMCCHQQDSAQLSYQRGYGPTAGQLRLPYPRRWKDDALYVDALKRPIGVLPLDRHTGAARSPLGRALAKDAKAVFCQPVDAGYTRGVLFVPLKAAPQAHKGVAALPDKMGYGTASLLHAYSRLLANAVETDLSGERVRGAYRSYGLLGHEIRGPATAIESAARKAISAGREAMAMLPEGPKREELERRSREGRDELLRAERRLAGALRLAKLVSRESEGQLKLRLDTVDLGQVLQRAVDEVQLQARDELLPWSTFVDVRPSARSLGDLVCDDYYIERVFANVLSNAVKYSLPRRRGGGPRDSVVVQVFGERQESLVDVRVRNWGWQVPEHMEDAIFRPWVRGYVEGKDAALSGMGVGLHLARRLMAAHDGDITFTCQPTEDTFAPRMTRDQRDLDRRARERRDPVRIYETDFAIRVPRNLTPGVRTHVWSAGGEGGGR